MIQFLENHCKYLERTSVEKTKTHQSNNIKKKSSTNNTNSKSFERLTSHATTKVICPLCQASHSLYNFEKFGALPIESRIDEVRKQRFCFNCLITGRHNRQCNAGSRNKCHKKHNTLLHLDYFVRPQTTDSNTQVELPAPHLEPVNKTSTVLTNLNDPLANEEIMLGTAIVWVEDSSGKLHECPALLDSCSQVNIVTRKLCHRLKIEMSNSGTVVSGVVKAIQEPQYCKNIKFSSWSTKFSRNIKCLVASEITDDMPNLPVRRSDFEIPKGLVLADPLFTKTRPVNLLIGASLFYSLICVGQKHLRRDHPILQKTQLGWIVADPMPVPSCTRKAVCNLITNQQLHDQVKQFWEIENHKLKNNFLKLDHHDELEHFLFTTEPDEDGRFAVTMHFKDKINELGECLHTAEKRFISMECKSRTWNLGKNSSSLWKIAKNKAT
ncbi:uncharacterized protein LOC117178646 [Belonocnema kinseyi]|uniref:uncharacterized protein LOC117178646 n=1 Tax=Belonocnema kinseyi TaxID=2817044 RepID=UPI00143D3647|nr:uncharacterized protein LOC117178646 [Belonocnema kinseyi]